MSSNTKKDALSVHDPGDKTDLTFLINSSIRLIVCLLFILGGGEGKETTQLFEGFRSWRRHYMLLKISNTGVEKTDLPSGPSK